MFQSGTNGYGIIGEVGIRELLLMIPPYATGNDILQGAALRWLRAEYMTKTDARAELGVRRIIGDENFYDSLKLFAAFCVKAGYTGLLVNLDEMVVLLNVLDQNPGRDWQSFLGDVSFSKRDNVISIEEEIANGVPPPADTEDNLVTFKL
jgi:hypothetical protein